VAGQYIHYWGGKGNIFPKQGREKNKIAVNQRICKENPFFLFPVLIFCKGWSRFSSYETIRINMCKVLVGYVVF